MSIRNGSRDPQYGLCLGLDTTSQPASCGTAYVRIARNANLHLSSGLSKRDGYSAQLDTEWGTKEITGGIEFKQKAFDSKIILFSNEGTLADLTSGTASVIRTSLSSNRPSLIQFGDRLFFYNGDDADAPFLYDDQQGDREIGIAAPTVAPTDGGDTTGDMNTGGTDTYIYAYTYYNSRTKAESSPSPSLKGVQTNTGGVLLGVTAGDSDYADKIRIYRTVAGGTTLILEGENDIADTTFTSNTGDDVLGVAFANRLLELDNSRISDLTQSAKYAIVADNRVFVVVNSNEIRFSKIGQDGPMPESFQVTATVPTESRYGSTDPLVGLGQIKDRVIVLKQRSIGYLEPIGLPGINESIDPVQYLYREISDVTGAISHFAGGQVGDEYVFLGRDNVYATNGITIRPIGNTIQETIRNMGFALQEIERISFINDTKNKRIYIAGFEATGEPDPSFLIVGDYQLYGKGNSEADFRWTFYTPGDDRDTHPGLNVGCFFTTQSDVNGSLEIFFAESRPLGQYYKMNDTESDDGFGIHFEVGSRELFHGNESVQKLFRDIEILGKSASRLYTLEVCYRIDCTPRDFACQEFFLPVEGGLWEDDDDFVYNWADEDEENNNSNTLYWAGEQVAIVTFHAHIKCYYLQIIFRQLDPDSPITLIGWDSIASMFGRK